jgi:serine phosphatase RsbU (regulator of sigma subunit)
VTALQSPLHDPSHNNHESTQTSKLSDIQITDKQVDYQQRQAVLESYGLLDTEPEGVFDKITRLAIDVFNVPVALISLMDFDQDRQWFKSCHGLDTRETDLSASFCLHAVLNDDTLVVPDTLQDATFKDYSLVQSEPYMRFYAGAPLRTPEGIAIGALALIDFVPREALSDTQLSMLETLASVVVDEILLRRSLEEQCRIEAELHESTLKPAQAKLERYQTELLTANAKLEVARSIQTSLQPRYEDISAAEDLDIATYARPAEDVGGDYLDVIALGGGVRIGIGDVTGHGFESGLLMVMVQTAISALVHSGISDPQVIISVLNKTLYHNLQRLGIDKSLTLSLLEYDQGTITVSGQHEYLLRVSPTGEVTAVDTFALGFPLGLEPDIDQYTDQLRFTLAPGAGVVLYTDGITEAENATGEFYGLSRLEDTIHRAWQQHPKEHSTTYAEDVKQFILDDLQAFTGQQAIFDDITLIIVKRKIQASK